MYAAGKTDVGLTRSQNQDSIYVSATPVGPLPNLFIVADGMGGHNAGDEASKQAVKLISGYISDFPAAAFVKPDNYLDLLVNAVQFAGGMVYSQAEEDPAKKGMGTTVTACVVRDEKIVIAHIGDSRAYAVSPERITQLTTDHTYVEQLLKTGRLTPEEARNHPRRHVLTRVLGAPGHCEVDGIVPDISDATAVLLCSDGLSNMLDNEKIMEMVNSLGHVEDRVHAMVNEANRRGGHDNISAILIDIKR